MHAKTRRSLHPKLRAAATAVAALFAANANAFEITTGDPDLQVRWDNTVRYNLGVRAQSQDSKILGNTNNDDGDRNFANHSIVTNRLDVLSEFDFVYKRMTGFRVSAAGWGRRRLLRASTTRTPRPRTRWWTDCRLPGS